MHVILLMLFQFLTDRGRYSQTDLARLALAVLPAISRVALALAAQAVAGARARQRARRVRLPALRRERRRRRLVRDRAVASGAGPGEVRLLGTCWPPNSRYLSLICYVFIFILSVTY